MKHSHSCLKYYLKDNCLLCLHCTTKTFNLNLRSNFINMTMSRMIYNNSLYRKNIYIEKKEDKANDIHLIMAMMSKI